MLARELGGDVCWHTVENPTDEHRARARELRKAAAAHRATSQALRDAEATACVGLSEDERDTSPFDQIEDIASVGIFRARDTHRSPPLRAVGAVITFVDVPGMTVPWLQKVVDCHLARNNALGHMDASMAECPLLPPGVTAKVVAVGNGFAVAIRSNDPATAKDILRRARLLVEGPENLQAR